MTRRKEPKPRLTITTPGRFDAEIRGIGTYRVLERLGCKRQFVYTPVSGAGQCWVVPIAAIADVVAQAEHLGGTATVDDQMVLA